MEAKTKKIAIGATALTLVAVTAVGGTLAYLTKITEKRANNFTFSTDGLDAMLVEPEWDGVIDYEYNEDGSLTPIYDYIEVADESGNKETKPVYGYTHGTDGSGNPTTETPITDKLTVTDTSKVQENRKKYETETDTDGNTTVKKDGSGNPIPIVYGDEEAQNMVPGQSAQKNPYIVNTGNISDEWVAAKVTFVHSENAGANAGKPLSADEMTAINAAIEIDWNTTSSGSDDKAYWDLISTSEDGTSKVFYYTQIIEKDGKQTESIFNTVTVKDEATNAQIQALEDMGGFAIYIEGYAAQDIVADYYSESFKPSGDTSTYKYFSEWAKSNVKFESDNGKVTGYNVTQPGIIEKNKSGVTTEAAAEETP